MSIFRTTTRSSYGLVTSAGRLVLAHVVELPVLAASPQTNVAGGIPADELIGMTESTDPIPGEHVVAAIPMDQRDDDGPTPAPLAIGTRAGVVKRWNREAPTTMDSWSVIDLKDGDSVLFAADAADEDRLVFIASDSSLLTFDAGNVRPQGRTAGGMAGIRLAEGCTAITFNVVPAGKIAWTYEEGDNGMFSASGAVVLTVAGDKDALPGTENGAAKVTPLEMYPTKGRGTGGVRSQRFLKGQNTLIFARVGMYRCTPPPRELAGGAAQARHAPRRIRCRSGRACRLLRMRLFRGRCFSEHRPTHTCGRRGVPSTFRQTRSSCRRAISDGTPCRMMRNAGWRTSRVDTPVTWR